MKKKETVSKQEAETATPSRSKIRISYKKVIIVFAVIVVAAAAIAPGLYFYKGYSEARKELMATANPQQEVDDLVKSVGKLIALPNETPTVASVSDITKLKGQAFFDKAQNGDKVLIYPQSKRAYLYRPSTDKLVEVTTVNITDATPSGQVAGEVAPVITRVGLLNGTTVNGLTRTLEGELKDIENITIETRANAAKQDYSETIVVDVSGKNQALAKILADRVGGRVGSLPEGEQKHNSDILVIIGEDYVE